MLPTTAGQGGAAGGGAGAGGRGGQGGKGAAGAGGDPGGVGGSFSGVGGTFAAGSSGAGPGGSGGAGAGGTTEAGAGGEAGQGGQLAGGEGGLYGSAGQGGVSGSSRQTGEGGEAGAGGDAGVGGGEDRDGDGWSEQEGDCCDRPEDCGDPGAVNPGAFEVPGNGQDDDCDQEIDEAEGGCDGGQAPEVKDGEAAARALGLCAVTTDDAPLPLRRWGLLEATLRRADGSVLQDLRAVSVRGSFGALATTAWEGERMLVLSTGVAADGQQTTPGPNGGAPQGKNVSTSHEPSSMVELDQPAGPWALSGWFEAPGPTKPAGSLPVLEGCPGQSSNRARDSVMLALRLRAPTNGRSFSFKTRFVSAEYPEYVCTSYNDQFVAVLGGPGALLPGPGGDLLVYRDPELRPWPVSVNLALTPQFSVCAPKASAPSCWKEKIHPGACQEGAGPLAGTGFETPQNEVCPIGGATRWFEVRGGVIPGQEVSLRIALWDVGDTLFDSTAIVDDFRWSTALIDPASGATPLP